MWKQSDFIRLQRNVSNSARQHMASEWEKWIRFYIGRQAQVAKRDARAKRVKRELMCWGWNQWVEKSARSFRKKYERHLKHGSWDEWAANVVRVQRIAGRVENKQASASKRHKKATRKAKVQMQFNWLASYTRNSEHRPYHSTQGRW